MFRFWKEESEDARELTAADYRLRGENDAPESNAAGSRTPEADQADLDKSPPLLADNDNEPTSVLAGNETESTLVRAGYEGESPPAVPVEVPLSGACGGIHLLGLEDTQIRQMRRSSCGVWCNRVGKGCRVSTSHAAPNAFFKHFGADVQRNVAAGHEKTARGCEENGSRSSRPTA
jgi:hypothetical protein